MSGLLLWDNRINKYRQLTTSWIDILALPSCKQQFGAASWNFNFGAEETKPSPKYKKIFLKAD